MMENGLTTNNMDGESGNTGINCLNYYPRVSWSCVYIVVLVTPMKAIGLMVLGMVMDACSGVTEESSTPATGSMESR